MTSRVISHSLIAGLAAFILLLRDSWRLNSETRAGQRQESQLYIQSLQIFHQPELATVDIKPRENDYSAITAAYGRLHKVDPDDDMQDGPRIIPAIFSSLPSRPEKLT
jgi:hypothetical protein